MKKDMRSYEMHNKDYEELEDFYKKENIIERTEKTNDFVRAGFNYAISITKNMPNNHVDIGSGVGWLVRKMAPHFKKSIGIEPSKAATSAAKKLTENLENVYFIEKDMLDGYRELNIEEPAFFTTGAVLSHIEDYYVAEFLKLLNNAPYRSVLFFSENYDRNMQWTMWHIRSQEWWVKNLPNWQLTFCNIEIDEYSSGIYGVCVGKENILKNHKRGIFWEISWKVDRVITFAGRATRKILKLLYIMK